MAIEESTTPVKAVFDPSRNGLDNDIKRTLYGQVLRFPSLPPAHAVFEGVTVFDMSTKDFYECQHIVTVTENYYEWVAVTFGAARVFLIPVGKLTENDISEYTEKMAIDCVANTINEIINGLIRYKKPFCYLGYRNVPVGETLRDGVTYYGYKYNDLIDITGQELHKIYTGEVKALATSEYVIGSTVEQDYVYFTKEPDPDMTDCVNRLNEIIALLNKHFANIEVLPTDPFPTYDQIAKVLNDVVEEVNPFAVPWQIVINRIWHLEQKVGNGNFVENDDTNPANFVFWWRKSFGVIRDNDPEYPDHRWLNVPVEIQEALKFATICQINDSIFKLLQAMDDQIGDLITFLADEGDTYGITFESLVDYLKYVVAQIPEIRRRLELALEGIRQLRVSLGNLGYILATDTYFKDGTAYYLWNKVNMKMDEMIVAADADEHTPPELIYNINQTFAEWHELHTSSDEYAVEQIYVFSSDDTAEQLIKINAANIAQNAHNIALINAILGTDLGDKFYIETLSIPLDDHDNVAMDLYRCDVNTTEDYGANKGTTFTIIDDARKGYAPLKDYDTLYKENGPIFVLGTPKVVCEIIEMNNREIAALNRRLSARIQNIEENMNVRAEKLKELTGVEGVTEDHETWHVDGYKKVILPCSTRTARFEKYTKYYKQVTAADTEEYENHFIVKWKVTLDTHFKAGKKYYRPTRKPPYNEPDEDNWVLLIEGTDYQVGDPIENVDPTTLDEGDSIYCDIIVELQETYTKTQPTLFVELVEGTDYTIPSYVLTEDETFDPEKTYFKRNVAGVYSEATKGTRKQYLNGECSYWINSYFPTKDSTFQEGKTYYSGDPDENTYEELTGGTVEQYDEGLVDYYYGQEVQESGIYEFGSMTVPAKTYYEYKEEESSIINRYSNVWVRDRRWKEYNTHRGLIDRNTDDIIAQRLLCGQFRQWTQGQIAAIKDFIMYMMLATLEIVTQENSTFSILHNTTAKLITILNAISKLEGKEDYKHADGVYDAAYDYYRAIGFALTTDKTFVPGKTYFIEEYAQTADVEFQANKKYFKKVNTDYIRLVEDEDYTVGDLIESAGFRVYDVSTYREAVVTKYQDIPADTYYEANDFRRMIPDEDFEIGLEVNPRVFSLDFVMPTVENYTMTEIKDAVNRVLRFNMADPNLPTYTALPIDQEIQANLVYYRYVDDQWERIVPEEDDPDMIGQLIKVYDPDHVWYLKMDEEIADDGYTMTWIRVMMNEMIRLHNRGAEQFNNAFANFVAQ